MKVSDPSDASEREARNVARSISARSGVESPRMVQRAGAPHAGHEVTSAAIAASLTRLPNEGTPFQGPVRASMESRFGTSFDGVRIHTGLEAARLARSVDAVAFTVGRDIVFGEGTFAAGTTTGIGLLAHELTHVVQQEGAVKSDGVTVQRYQAGERGHGGIEAEALHRAGFGGTMTEGEIGSVYLGNWMRDWSQIGDPHDAKVLTLLNVLSMGEFNRRVTAEDVGGYLPSEHLDRPTGGGSVEDPTATSMPESDWTGLSKNQQEWVRLEQNPMFQSYISDRAKANDLPPYIETGKFHAKVKLAEAARAGRGNQAGMAAMGNGLHAIEDYFSHSNFVDAAVYMLVRDGELSPQSKLYRGIVARTKEFGYNPFNPDPRWSAARGGKAAIVSGAYRKDGNKAVSILEQLESEIKTGALRKAAVLGAIRLGMVNAGAAGRSAGGKVGRAVVGGLAAAGESVGEAATGAAHGMAEGWRQGHGVGAVWDAVKGAWVEGEKGASEGASWGWSHGGDLGQRGGGRAGELIGEGLGAAVEAVAVGAVVALVTAAIESVRLNPLLNPVVAEGTEKLSEHETKVATKADRKAGDPLPNHSQLAKDDTEHPLFGVSRDLAVAADEAIGKAMIHAWERHADTESVDALTALVDVYVSHPADNAWWRTPLLASIYGGVRSAP